MRQARQAVVPWILAVAAASGCASHYRKTWDPTGESRPFEEVGEEHDRVRVVADDGDGVQRLERERTLRQGTEKEERSRESWISYWQPRIVAVDLLYEPLYGLGRLVCYPWDFFHVRLYPGDKDPERDSEKTLCFTCGMADFDYSEFHAWTWAERIGRLLVPGIPTIVSYHGSKYPGEAILDLLQGDPDAEREIVGRELQWSREGNYWDWPTVTEFRPAPGMELVLASPGGEVILRGRAGEGGQVSLPRDLIGETWDVARDPDGALRLTVSEDLAHRLAEPAHLVASVRFLDGDRPLAPADCLDATETAHALLAVANEGPGPAYAVRVETSCEDPGVKVGAAPGWDYLAPGETREARVPLVASRDVAEGRASITLRATEERGHDAAPVVLVVSLRPLVPPALEVAALALLDGAGGFAAGNGDGVAESGETVEVVATLGNRGPGAATGVRLTLSCEAEGVEVLRGEAGPFELTPGDRARASFQLALATPFVPPAGGLVARVEAADPRGVGGARRETTLPARASRPELDVVVRLLDPAGREQRGVPLGGSASLEATVRNRGRMAARDVRVRLSLGEHLPLDGPAERALGTVPAASQAAPVRWPFRVLGGERAGARPGPLPGRLAVAQAGPFPGLEAGLEGLSILEREAVLEEVRPGAPTGAPAARASPPVVVVVEPRAEATATTGATMRLLAIASDPGGLASWRVLWNGAVLREEGLRDPGAVVPSAGAAGPAGEAPRSATIDLELPLDVGSSEVVVEARGVSGLEARSEPLLLTRRAATGRTFVLAIGIDDYADGSIADLRYAEADARRVCAFFRDDPASPARAEDCQLLLGAAATKRGIALAVDEHLVRRATSEEDTVVLYYSGHGDADTVERRGDEYYLVPQDAARGRFFSTALEVSELQRWWDAMAARTRVFIADSCNSGGFSSLRGEAARDFSDALGEGRIGLLASRRGQRAMEVEALGGGLFTHYLLRALKEADAAPGDGDGRVSASELRRYLLEAVPRAARELGGAQEPHLKLDAPGEVYLTR